MLQGAHIGIDIGRVIMAPTHDDGSADTSFLQGRDEDAMRTPPSEGAFPVIAELNRLTDGKVWLVSKAGPRIQGLTRRWLHRWGFYETTGLNEQRVHFCLQRRDKAEHARQLRLSHFIDDRLDVLQHLHMLVPSLYLFGVQRRGTAIPPWVISVRTWTEVEAQLLP